MQYSTNPGARYLYSYEEILENSLKIYLDKNYFSNERDLLILLIITPEYERYRMRSDIAAKAEQLTSFNITSLLQKANKINSFIEGHQFSYAEIMSSIIDETSASENNSTK